MSTTYPLRAASPWRRPAARLFLSLLLLVGASCANTGSNDRPSAGPDEAPEVSARLDGGEITADDSAAGDPAVDIPATGAVGADGTSALADLVTELPPAPIGPPPTPVEQPRPVGLTIEALGIDVAPVIGVGVEDNGDMEVPPARQVGWYRYGPTPGRAGSSVLAAHIAFDGVDGVFVDLKDLELGSVIEVGYDDGTTARFEAVALEQYDKTELPKQWIFDRDGHPRLVLITCGGDFNRQVRSYDDNIVVYAEPIEP